ncbi:hypothetical protein yrohd0001_38900 [Yersinia rohdei ATCC 43380]|nr:hypothetical protein yrohd0001_38900 [Yersinia rohdei ATCC 43380]
MCINCFKIINYYYDSLYLIVHLFLTYDNYQGAEAIEIISLAMTGPHIVY